MTTRTTLLALAERVEAATGADSGLDSEIHHAILNGVGVGSYGAQPAYTASLDAAMSLVPSGLSWTLGQNVHHKHWLASVNYLNSDGAPACAGDGCSNSTPALALTAASLRAIAGSLTDD